MQTDFVCVRGSDFTLGGQPFRMRGFALGSWMNLEHFMIGLPGTHSMILESLAEVYGPERAGEFLAQLQEAMVGEEDIAYLKALGTNTLRIPFSYHAFLDDQHPDRFRPEGFAALERVVRLCRKHRLRVILDLHSVPGAQNNDWHADSTTGQSLFWKYALFRRQACGLWRELARRYAGDPWIIGYDVLNEPGYGLPRDVLNGFWRDVTAAIRAEDSRHILFLEGDDFGRSFSLLDPPEDEQTALAVHYYPFVTDENILDPDLPRPRREALFRGIFDRQLSLRDTFRRPVWCGETGYNILEDREDFCRDLLLMNLSLCEEAGIGWSVWTYKDARRMGLVIPRRDSPWMALRRRMEQRWSHEWEMEASLAATRSLWKYFDREPDEKLTYDLEFRVRSVFHRIETETLLKPLLRTVPWEDLLSAVQSFRFAACERREQVERGLRGLLAAVNENPVSRSP